MKPSNVLFSVVYSHWFSLYKFTIVYDIDIMINYNVARCASEDQGKKHAPGVSVSFADKSGGFELEPNTTI